MKKQFICAFIALAVCSGEMHGQTTNVALKPGNALLSGISADELRDNCKRIDEADILADDNAAMVQAINRAACIIEIRGFHDGYGAAMGVFNNGKASCFCLPDGVTFGQQARVIVKYANTHPEGQWAGAAILIWAALSDAYPCKLK
jgi:hypothetical protein